VYVTLNGYRWDNFEALVYKSANYGKTWQRIGRDLPAEPVNVIKEDPQNADILYVGTDHGLYISLNGGTNFMAFDSGLPEVPVHDLVVHPRDKKIVVATHGRSLFLADVAPVEALTTKLQQEPLHLFPLKSLTHRKSWGQRRYDWTFTESPKLEPVFYCKKAGSARLRLKDSKKRTVWQQTMDADAGLNFANYDLTVSPALYKKLVQSLKKQDRPQTIKPADNGCFYLVPGTYTLELRQNGKKVHTTFELKAPKTKSRAKKKKIP
jgi:hypothetical protein